MMKTFLTINGGSTSVKFALFGARQDLPLQAAGQVQGIGDVPVLIVDGKRHHLPPDTNHDTALREIINWIVKHDHKWLITAVGHRIVHGGPHFTAPVRLNEGILAQLEKLDNLAPLHQKRNLCAVWQLIKLLPNVPQIGVFDTAFHATEDALHTSFALPAFLREGGIRRYGFHGLSYEWITKNLEWENPELARGRVVAAHLGSGASVCGIHKGKSVDTSMGMTALDGLPMGTRSGSIDPGVLIYLEREMGMTVDGIEQILYGNSGLKGLSGISYDVQVLLRSNQPEARFALEFFSLKTAQFMAAMVVSLGGVDGFVFTGGIGEHAEPVRESIMKRLAFLGSKSVHVIPANEERMIALHMKELECLTL